MLFQGPHSQSCTGVTLVPGEKAVCADACEAQSLSASLYFVIPEVNLGMDYPQIIILDSGSLKCNVIDDNGRQVYISLD